MITLEYKIAALSASHFYTSHFEKLEKRAKDAIFLEMCDALDEIKFFVNELQDGDFEQLFIFRKPEWSIDYGGRAFITVNMKRIQNTYQITQYDQDKKGKEFMSFDPAYWGVEVKEAWSVVFFTNFIWWIENYGMMGFKRDRLMHFSKSRLGSREPGAIMNQSDYLYQNN
jgi:hypothetical protein